MARGGARSGAGRPRGSKSRSRELAIAGKIDGIDTDIVKAALKSGVTPIEYMLAVMRNGEADQVRRDRMAIAAAPFCHARADADPEGKKEKRQANAELASSEGKFAAPAGPKLAIDNTHR